MGDRAVGHGGAISRRRRPVALQSTIYIELIVDGDIVDLNRIPLPRDTPIVDERFVEGGS